MIAKKILVVEDDETTLELMRMVLVQQGYEVVTAMDGIDGFERAIQTRPDLIVTDIYMPAADGIHLVRRVRDDASISATPIMVTTGSGTGSGIFSLANGADAYERKPFELKRFLSTVERLLADEQSVKIKTTGSAL